MTGNPSEIREELEKLERKHAEHPEGRYFVPLANAYRKAGEMDRAIQVLREGLATHPDYVSAHIVLGRCLVEKGSVAAAESEFRRVLALDPQNLIALRTIAEIAVEDGRVEEAQRWYRELLKVDPMNEDARRALDGMQMIAAPAVTPLAPTSEDAASSAEPAWREPEVTHPGVVPAPPQSSAKPISTAAEFDVFFGGGRDARESHHDDDQPFPVEGQSVVTETIAELYTRQGFYARAADVYRELIRRRGPSPELEERLRRVESLAAGEVVQEAGSPGEALDARAAVPPVDETPIDVAIASPEIDPFAESFVEGFTRLDDEEALGYDKPTGRAPEFAAAEVSSVEAEEAAAVPGSETIRDYLWGVLSWQPAPGTEEAAPILETPESEPAFATDEPTPGLMQSHDDELFPWELPDEPSATTGSEPSDTRSDDLSDELGDDLSDDLSDMAAQSEPSATSAAADPHPEAASAAAPPPEPASLPAPAPTAPPAPAETSAPASASTEDEDLESFQAWLRSLKR